MSDEEVINEVIFMVSDYINQADYMSPTELVSDLIEFLLRHG
jgi:hypothetical protein